MSNWCCFHGDMCILGGLTKSTVESIVCAIYYIVLSQCHYIITPINYLHCKISYSQCLLESVELNDKQYIIKYVSKLMVSGQNYVEFRDKTSCRKYHNMVLDNILKMLYSFINRTVAVTFCSLLKEIRQSM